MTADKILLNSQMLYLGLITEEVVIACPVSVKRQQVVS